MDDTPDHSWLAAIAADINMRRDRGEDVRQYREEATELFAALVDQAIRKLKGDV
jgi:hypothetical protein